MDHFRSDNRAQGKRKNAGSAKNFIRKNKMEVKTLQSQLNTEKAQKLTEQTLVEKKLQDRRARKYSHVVASLSHVFRGKSMNAEKSPLAQDEENNNNVEDMKNLSLTDTTELEGASKYADSNATSGDVMKDNVDEQHSNIQEATPKVQEPDGNLREAIPKVEESGNTKLGLPSTYEKGVVPKYIKERKKELHDLHLKREKALVDASIPKGHYLLSEEERLEILKVLNESYNDAVAELSKLPISKDTLRIRVERKRLEDILKKTEEDIRFYSYSKVYIKIS